MVAHLELLVDPLELFTVVMRRFSWGCHQIGHEIGVVKVQHARLSVVEGQEVIVLWLVRSAMHEVEIVHPRHVRHHGCHGYAHSHGHLRRGVCVSIRKHARAHPLVHHYRCKRDGLGGSKTSGHDGRGDGVVSLW